MLDKAWTRFTLNIWARQNPPSPNERLSKGNRNGVATILELLDSNNICA